MKISSMAEVIKAHRLIRTQYLLDDGDCLDEAEAEALEKMLYHPTSTVADLNAKLAYLRELPTDWFCSLLFDESNVERFLATFEIKVAA